MGIHKLTDWTILNRGTCLYRIQARSDCFRAVPDDRHSDHMEPDNTTQNKPITGSSNEGIEPRTANKLNPLLFNLNSIIAFEVRG